MTCHLLSLYFRELVLEDLNVLGMVRNRKLSRAISDLGGRQFRTMLEAKAVMYCTDARSM